MEPESEEDSSDGIVESVEPESEEETSGGMEGSVEPESEEEIIAGIVCVSVFVFVLASVVVFVCGRVFVSDLVFVFVSAVVFVVVLRRPLQGPWAAKVSENLVHRRGGRRERAKPENSDDEAH